MALSKDAMAERHLLLDRAAELEEDYENPDVADRDLAIRASLLIQDFRDWVTTNT